MAGHKNGGTVTRGKLTVYEIPIKVRIKLIKQDIMLSKRDQEVEISI